MLLPIYSYRDYFGCVLNNGLRIEGGRRLLKYDEYPILLRPCRRCVSLPGITLHAITYSPGEPPTQLRQPRLLRAADAAIVRKFGHFSWTLSHPEVPKERSHGIRLLDGAMKPMRVCAYCSVRRRSNRRKVACTTWALMTILRSTRLSEDLSAKQRVCPGVTSLTWMATPVAKRFPPQSGIFFEKY